MSSFDPPRRVQRLLAGGLSLAGEEGGEIEEVSG
jgi:hypothetical protein